MGYLDYAGLQYLWGKLKEKFAPKSHSHDDRYYTEAEMDGKLNSKVNNNEAGANGLFSKLTTSWTATPTDNTYFIRQNTGGGNEFGRVKFSTLWNYIKGKTDGVYQPKGSYAASGHTHDDRYYTETEMNAKLDGKSNTGHTHDDRYYTETEIDTKLNGKAPNGHTHQYLSLYGARPANINFTKSTNGTGAMFHFVATSSTTTGKPPANSSILQLNWDNSGGWDSQLALSTAANPHVYYRNQQNGTWGNWSTLLDNLNYTDYAAKKEHTHTKSQITDFPSSLKNPTALTIQTNGTTAAIYDGSAAKTVNITKSNIGLGNVDNTADANKSVKYATSAGNASKVNNHTVNIDVPADAKFTDTNTWRGIQNNLTSDSTDQSLSAAQGKALKALVDGKAPASHTHKKSQITDFPSSMPASDVSAWAKAATKPSYTKAEVGLSNVDNTADKNKSVNYATSAGLATNAQCLNNDNKYMKFHWSGQKGQPIWLWGGNDSGDMYVYNPSNFNVNYATTARNGTVDFQTKVTTDGYFGAVRFGNGVQICWFTMKSARNRTFLLPFADINYAIAFSGGYCWLNINNRTTTGFTVGVEWSGYENSYIAIGRWK